MPLKALRDEGAEVRGLFYNPNIQPYTESQRRLGTAAQWAHEVDLPLIVQEEYDPESWMRMVTFREGERCRLCLHQRLRRAAQVAKKGGYEFFSSSLLYSVRQKHGLIRDLGQALAREQGVGFLYRDWRPLWRQGVEASQAAGMYRQPYCGCLFSERDRYLGRPAASGGRSLKQA